MSCATTLKPRLLQTGCVTPARKVARRFKILLTAPHLVATSAVCTNHVHQALQKDCLGSAYLNAWIAWTLLPNNANKISCSGDRFQMLFCSVNLWKDTEKSMTSSKVGLYYFEPKKKHLEFPLSAWFTTTFLVGDASFELATPAVWRLLYTTTFLNELIELAASW